MRQRLNITTPEYFALPHASNSSIKEAEKIFSTGNTIYGDSTKPFFFGSVFDALLTDIGNFDLTGMTENEINKLIPMKKALENDVLFKTLFHNSDLQAVFIDDELYVDGIGTIPAKCKYDLWSDSLNFGGDIKSTTAKTFEQFAAASKHFKYYSQAAWYMDITGTDRFIIFGISKENYKVFILSIKRGDNYYMEGFSQYTNNVRYWWMLNVNEIKMIKTL